MKAAMQQRPLVPRSLLKLWALTSAIWVPLVAFALADSFNYSMFVAHLVGPRWGAKEVAVPLECNDRIKKLSVEGSLCWYEMDQVRVLWPSIPHGAQEQEFIRFAYWQAGRWQENAALEKVALSVAFLFLCFYSPVVVFCLGAGLVWATRKRWRSVT